MHWVIPLLLDFLDICEDVHFHFITILQYVSIIISVHVKYRQKLCYFKWVIWL